MKCITIIFLILFFMFDCTKTSLSQNQETIPQPVLDLLQPITQSPIPNLLPLNSTSVIQGEIINCFQFTDEASRHIQFSYNAGFSKLSFHNNLFKTEMFNKDSYNSKPLNQDEILQITNTIAQQYCDVLNTEIAPPTIKPATIDIGFVWFVFYPRKYNNLSYKDDGIYFTVLSTGEVKSFHTSFCSDVPNATEIHISNDIAKILAYPHAIKILKDLFPEVPIDEYEFKLLSIKPLICRLDFVGVPFGGEYVYKNSKKIKLLLQLTYRPTEPIHIPHSETLCYDFTKLFIYLEPTNGELYAWDHSF